MRRDVPVSMVRAMLRNYLPGWSVEADASDDAVRVRVFRGFGVDIEYGTSVVTQRQVNSAADVSSAAQLFFDAAKEAKRQAEHCSWLRTRTNGVVLGVAGSWRKWSVANAA